MQKCLVGEKSTELGNNWVWTLRVREGSGWALSFQHGANINFSYTKGRKRFGKTENKFCLGSIEIKLSQKHISGARLGKCGKPQWNVGRHSQGCEWGQGRGCREGRQNPKKPHLHFRYKLKGCIQQRRQWFTTVLLSTMENGKWCLGIRKIISFSR